MMRDVMDFLEQKRAKKRCISKRRAKKGGICKRREEELIPYDILYEILIRITSLRTLDTCKAVCKSWNRILLQPSFMPSYSKITDTLSGYIVQDNGNADYKFCSMNLNHVRSKLWASNIELFVIRASSLQGIVCGVYFTGIAAYKFCVCKITTWELQELPLPDIDFAIGMSIVGLMVLGSKPLHYKILLISTILSSTVELGRCLYNVHIFDSKTWEWKKILERSCSETYFSQPVYAGGTLYFLFDFNRIVCVRGNDEAINYMTTPESNDLHLEHQLTEYQGKLGLICKTASGLVHLWILEDAAETKNWRKIKEMDLGFAAGNVFEFQAFHFYNPNILFMMNARKGIFCNLQDSTSEDIKFNDVFEGRYVYPFRSDWEPVDFKGSSSVPEILEE